MDSGVIQVRAASNGKRYKYRSDRIQVQKGERKMSSKLKVKKKADSLFRLLIRHSRHSGEPCRTANKYVEMANEGKMSILSMIQDIEENTNVRFDETNKNLVKKMGV